MSVKKFDPTKKLNIIIMILVVGTAAFIIDEIAFEPEMRIDIATKSFEHGRDSVIIEIYPSPAALHEAIERGDYHYDYLTPHMQKLLDSYRDETDKS